MIKQTQTVQRQLPLREQWYEMTTAAKLINEGLGRNKLLKFLRDNGFLMANNEPYQVHVDKGYFKVILKDIYTRNGRFLFRQPVTLISETGIATVKQLIRDLKSKNLTN